MAPRAPQYNPASKIGNRKRGRALPNGMKPLTGHARRAALTIMCPHPFDHQEPADIDEQTVGGVGISASNTQEGRSSGEGQTQFNVPCVPAWA